MNGPDASFEFGKPMTNTTYICEQNNLFDRYNYVKISAFRNFIG